MLLRMVLEVLEYERKGFQARKIPDPNKYNNKDLILSVGDYNEKSVMVLTMLVRISIENHMEFLEVDMYNICSTNHFVHEFTT